MHFSHRALFKGLPSLRYETAAEIQFSVTKISGLSGREEWDRRANAGEQMERGREDMRHGQCRFTLDFGQVKCQSHRSRD